MSWISQTEWLDEKDFARFQKELVRDPSGPPISHGTADLMTLFRTQGRS